VEGEAEGESALGDAASIEASSFCMVGGSSGVEVKSWFDMRGRRRGYLRRRGQRIDRSDQRCLVEVALGGAVLEAVGVRLDSRGPMGSGRA